jgi:hypothetical protein
MKTVSLGSMGVSWGGESHGSMPPGLPHASCVFHGIVSQTSWAVWGSFWVSTVLEYVTSPGMDADTQGLASALALLGVYNVADLVELAHTGSLVEMILTAGRDDPDRCGAARSGAACH